MCQHVCVEAILTFDRIYDDVGICYQLAKVNEGLIIYIYYNLPLTRANSADPDETPRFVSHLGPRCLYMFLFRMHSGFSTSAYFEF